METRFSIARFLTITVSLVAALPSILKADDPAAGSTLYRRVSSSAAPVQLASRYGRVATYVRPSVTHHDFGHVGHSYVADSIYPTWHVYQVAYRPNSMHSYSPQFSLQYPYLTYPLPHQPQLSAHWYYQSNYRPWYASPFGAWNDRPYVGDGNGYNRGYGYGSRYGYGTGYGYGSGEGYNYRSGYGHGSGYGYSSCCCR